MGENKTQRVYISGAISGLDYEKEVLPTFNDAQSKIEERGYIAVNPLNNGVSQDADWHEHMRADIKLLCDCDGIYMTKGWLESRGARLEYTIAQELGITYHKFINKKLDEKHFEFIRTGARKM